jgi:amidase
MLVSSSTHFLGVHTDNFSADDAATYDGAPVGVQIVARRYEEEKVWAIAKIVDAILKSSDIPS